ncbi:MAG: hypothetical protein KY460_17350 [Actinobacteria bacterium]|nr:hypothetical protein [Actinomycetota bacterium]
MCDTSALVNPLAPHTTQPTDEGEHPVAVGRRARPLEYIVLAVALVALTVPLFFDAYRIVAFETTPRDDYAPFLLAMVGERGEGEHRQPELLARSPRGYRILSVAPGIPLYYALPTYEFSQLEMADDAYLAATQALTMVSYLATIGVALVVYALARNRYGASVLASTLTAVTAILLTLYMGLGGIDPLAVCYIAIMLYLIDRPVAFGVLSLVAIAVNEKIVLVFAALLVGRWLWSFVRRSDVGRFTAYPQLIVAVVSPVLYLLARSALHLPGNGTALRLGDVGSDLAIALVQLPTLKGLVVTIIPVGVLVALVVVAARVTRRPPDNGSVFHVPDVLVLAFFVFLATQVMVGDLFNGGRIAMHTFPLYVGALARWLDVVTVPHAAARRPPV